MNLTFAITDVHGCLDLLIRLQQACIAHAGKNNCVDPLFVYLGDYIDRGPDSAGVIANLRSFVEQHRSVVLKGNHDDMMVRALEEDDDPFCNWIATWANNGFSATLQSYGYGYLLGNTIPGDSAAHGMAAMRDDPLVMRDVDFLKNCLLSYEDELRYFVHAGVNPRFPLNNQRPSDQLWIREEFFRSPIVLPKHIVHGHTAHQYPELFEQRTNIDTGAYAYGKLTAAVFDDEQAKPIELIAVSR